MMQFQSRPPETVAYLRGGTDNPGLFGIVKVYPQRRGTLVVADVFGLPAKNPSDFFALHIHEGSSCTGTGFSETGSHYDLSGSPHPQHAVDLPPLLC